MDDSSVYYQGQLFEGISPAGIKYEKGTGDKPAYIYYDEDAAWYIDYSCEGFGFLPEKIWLDRGWSREKYLLEYRSGC